jgi:hypothetical protein
MGWLVGFDGGTGVSTSITSIETSFGTPLFPGGYIPQGPVTVAVYEDPNDDGNPSDGVLLTSTTATVSPGSIDTDVFQTITLPSAVSATGVFFVLAVVNHNAGEFPGPLDQSSGGGGVCGAGPGSWVAGDTTGTFNYTVLSANNDPPQTMASVGLPGNWLLRVNCGPSGPTGTAYCFGDGSGGAACPCGNNGAAGNGCAHSLNPAGANLAGSGTASVSSDSVVLTGSGMPPTTTCLYFQGTSAVDVVFGDGKRCVGGSIVRLGTKTNVGGTSQFPAAGDPSITVRAATYSPPQPIAAGDIRSYQCWYRNAAAFCTPATFNLTNGYAITWGP